MNNIIRQIFKYFGMYICKLPHNFDVDFGSIAKAKYFDQMFTKIYDIEGDIVECGVGAGESLMYLSVFNQIEGKHRNFYGLDSFEGFPKPSIQDISKRNPKEGEWKVTDVESLYERITCKFGGRKFNFDLKLIKGFFEDSITDDLLSEFSSRKIALLHIDADLYDSYKVVLERLWDSVSIGGIVMFDEYIAGQEKFPGSVIAVDEFFSDKDITIEHNTYANRHYCIKR